MTISIDHIFLMASQNRADDLAAAGFTEGSGRKHPGVGTQNRRFFFNDFYLEILWVHNRDEAMKNRKLGIWERFNYRQTGYSPFGLCLENCGATEDLFQNAMKWQPEFLSPGRTVDIITDEKMPWIFRFPAERNKGTESEPRDHPAGVEKLTRAVFQLKHLNLTETVEKIERYSIIEFREADADRLLLEFDHGRESQVKEFDDLNLTIKY